MSKELMTAWLENLTEEESLLTIGSKTGDSPVSFEKKRITHAGVSGAPIMPPSRAHAIWREKMSERTQAADKRAAYIHIPFCSQVCLYCGFFQNRTDEQLETTYIDHLVEELRNEKDKPYLQTGLLHSVFFGGGTPSALSPANVTRLLATVRECLPLSNDCEITFESRINDLSPDKMEAWFANGVNRVSIGVQSFDTDIRQRVGRINRQEEVIAGLKRVTAYNQASVIIDLIYGLPGQKKADFLTDLAIIDSLPIDGMDLYRLNVFEDGPLVKAINSGKIPPTGTIEEQAEMFTTAVQWLDERVYFRLSNCHWAKNNRERSMYNLLVKEGVEIFPYGAGAGGNINGLTMMLQRDIKKYMDTVKTGEKPIMVSFFEAQGKNLHKSITGQLEVGCLNLSKLSQEYGRELVGLEVLLDLWTERGLFSKGQLLYRLSTAGQFWSKNITQTVLEFADRLLAEKSSNPCNKG